MQLCVKTLINHITHPAAAAGSRRCLWSVLQDWLQELFLAKLHLHLKWIGLVVMVVFISRDA